MAPQASRLSITDDRQDVGTTESPEQGDCFASLAMTYGAWIPSPTWLPAESVKG